MKHNYTGFNRSWLNVLLMLGMILLLIGSLSAQKTQPKKNIRTVSIEENENEGEDVLAREKFIYERRAGGPGKTVPADGYSKAIAQYRALARKYAARMVTSTSWVSTNPTGMFYQRTGANYISGRANAVAFYPSDPNTFFIGAAGGGIWKTTNGGTTFTALTDNIPNLSCGALAVDQSNPLVMYFGTGELNYSLDSHYGDGIYKSYDGGTTWKQVATNSIGSKFSNIAIDPTNSNTVYASGSNGVYKSTDAGLSWNSTGSGSNANCVLIDPTNTQVLYTTVGGTGNNTVKKSVNAGSTWSTIMTGMTASSVYRTQLAMAASNSSTLYASCANSSGGLSAVYKTVDGGSNWTSQSTSPNYLGTQGWYDNAIAVKPSDATYIVAGGLDVYSSSNSGTTLTQRSAWATTTSSNFTHADIHYLGYNGSKLYCCSDGGVFVSNDDGATWTDLNSNLSTLQYQSGDYDPTNTQNLYGGCQDNNLETSTNGGTQWIQRTTGDGGYTVVDPVTTTTVYGQYVGGSLKRSLDSGVSFTEIGPSGSTGGLFYNPYRMAPGDHNTIVFGRADLWKTTSATTATTSSGWSQIATTATVGAGASVSSIGISSTSVNKIYFGTNTGKVFVTSNNGTNWSSQNLGQYVSSLTVDPSDDNICYAALGGYGSYQTSTGHVYKTTNGGTSWTNITGDLPAIPANAIVLKSSGTRTLFLGTDLGVYQSQDEGTSWTPFNTGLPTIPIFDLKFKEGNQILMAATHGRGCYFYDLNTASGPAVFISPSNLYFGNINGTGTTKTVTVTNTGTSTLTISLAISNNPELTVTPTTASIAPATSATFTLKFAAASAGLQTGTVTFSHNAPGGLSYVYASANGVAPFSAPVQLDVVFILDVTGSTGALLPQWKAQMPTIINNFNNSFPNSRFGLASHLDYPFAPYGGAGEYAYRLESSLNNNTSGLMTALNNLSNGWGDDDPESQYEAIYQAITGSGRDLNGNSSYADVGDIAPSNMNYQAGNPTVIMHFTYPPLFHDRDVEPNYPYPGSQPVAGRTAAINALLSKPAMYFGLKTTAAEKAKTNQGKPYPLSASSSLLTSDPMVELAGLTGGAVLSTDVDLSELSAAIDSSVGKISENTALYRSFSPDELLAKVKGKYIKPTKRGKGMPNIANLLDEVVSEGGFAPYTSESDNAGGLVVGHSFLMSTCKDTVAPCTKWKPQPDSAKKYAWLRLTKWDSKKHVGSAYTDLLSTLEDKTGMHTGAPRGLDSLFAKGKPSKKLVGQVTKLSPKMHNNHLLSELIALKFNIAASMLGKTPAGFGELMYNESNSLNGLMVKEIADRADSALTLWRAKSWEYVVLDSVIYKINRAFQGNLDASDTISFASPEHLMLKGEKSLYGVPFLKPSSEPPTRIIPGKFAEGSLDNGDEDDAAGKTLPQQFALYQAYPNPFNPTTSISYVLPVNSYVTLKIYDVLGREVATLVDGQEEAGLKRQVWNASSMPSGIYFYRINARSTDQNASDALKQPFTDAKKVILLR